MVEQRIKIDRETDESFFHTALDLFPDDSAARFLLAEWMGERGDGMAAGYYWMSAEGIMPQDYRGTRTWDWNDELHFSELTGAIPHSLFDQLKGGRLSISSGYREYPDRKAAELALCRVFAAERDIDLTEPPRYRPLPRSAPM